MKTIETIELWFDCLKLDKELSDPENEKTDLDIRGLKIPLFESFPKIQEVRKYNMYFAIGTLENYILYGILPNNSIKEIWKDK